MSYILDALRRAESDRQRGQVPGLGVSQVGDAAAQAAHPTRWRRLMLLLLVALAVGAAGLLGWWRGARTPSTLPAPDVAAARPTTPLAPSSPPQPVAAPAPAPLPMVVSAPPAAPTKPSLAAAMAASAPQMAAAAPAPTAAAADVQQAAPVRPVRFTELSPDQRREFPPIVVGGSVWSDSAASRFVIVNGQVLREGDSVAPGLVLDRLLPKTMQLRWRGMLLELPL